MGTDNENIWKLPTTETGTGGGMTFGYYLEGLRRYAELQRARRPAGVLVVHSRPVRHPDRDSRHGRSAGYVRFGP